MKRLMVKLSDGDTVNIAADKLTTPADDSGYIIAMKNGEIVGVFDMGNVVTLYLSEMNGGK